MNQENSDNPELGESERESGAFDFEENIIRIILTILIPVLVCFTAFYVIVLAYSQWKLF